VGMEVGDTPPRLAATVPSSRSEVAPSDLTETTAEVVRRVLPVTPFVASPQQTPQERAVVAAPAHFQQSHLDTGTVELPLFLTRPATPFENDEDLEKTAELVRPKGTPTK